MTDVRMASEGQINYIAKLCRERAVGVTVPHIDGHGDREVRIKQLTFDQAKHVLRFLTDLPEPLDKIAPASITDAQRNMIWALLKSHNLSTFKLFTLRRDDDSIPHLDNGEYDDRVWDWIGDLSRTEANDVILHLAD